MKKLFNIKNIKKLNKKTKISICFLVFAVCFLLWWEIYVPNDLLVRTTDIFTVKKGQGDDEIAKFLKEQGIIRSDYFFRFYVVVFGMHSKLEAGKYNLSPSMSLYKIVKKFVTGDVIKQKVVVLEGWDISDIAKELESKGVCSREEFLQAAAKDYSSEFAFLKEKPKNVGLEGYLFPDTYLISLGETGDDIIKNMLANFDKKVTPDLRAEILAQKKSVFEVITMASIIEKEVKKTDDKKIVAGILWKRLEAGMPLQVDATINYITGKNDPGVAIKDTRVDSLYNTYKYKGLPLGPISNPGADSISAALHPKMTQYWYYLSSFTGKTIFSATFQEHSLAMAKYLR